MSQRKLWQCIAGNKRPPALLEGLFYLLSVNSCGYCRSERRSRDPAHDGRSHSGWPCVRSTPEMGELGLVEFASLSDAICNAVLPLEVVACMSNSPE